MKIKILYESKYSLSTSRDGYNIIGSMGDIEAEKVGASINLVAKDDSPLQSEFNETSFESHQARDFINSVKDITKTYPNFKYADVTKNTVMGILSRLMGEVRRLDDLDNTHPVIQLSDKVSFKNINKEFQSDLVALRSPGNLVKDGAGGVLSKDKEDIFLLSKNPLSETLMSVFLLDSAEDLQNLLKDMWDDNPKYFKSSYPSSIDIMTFIDEFYGWEKRKSSLRDEIYSGFFLEHNGNKLESFGKKIYIGPVEDMNMFFKKLERDPKAKAPAKVTLIQNIWGYVFAEKINYLKRNNQFLEEISKVTNSTGCMRGLAPGSGGFTIREYYLIFMDKPKKSYTLPYSISLDKKKIQVENKDDEKDKYLINTKARVGVVKECGTLEIYIDIPKEDALKLYERIQNAGVNTFHLGKKGLAYVESINLENL